MKHNKSLGLDGISTEFYQAFWPLLGNLLTEVGLFNESYENGYLPDLQRKAVLSLIHEKGNEDDITNYRPISLTQCRLQTPSIYSCTANAESYRQNMFLVVVVVLLYPICLRCLEVILWSNFPSLFLFREYAIKSCLN